MVLRIRGKCVSLQRWQYQLGQDSAGTGKLEKICLGIGVDPAHLKVIIPLPANYKEMEKIIREELEYKGTSVIIARRECIQTARRHALSKNKK
jgi:indolepyruvate ferredoxin oxidoreductase alpha subunit